MKNIRNSFHFEYENIVMKISIKDNSLNSSRDNIQMGCQDKLENSLILAQNPAKRAV